jgi:O-antigen/teichoic acid export membrane protein
MPGAPPYPAGVEHPPAPVGRGTPTTSFPVVLAACAVAAALNVALVLIFGPVTPVTAVLAPVVVAAVTAPVLWAVLRHRRLPFPVLLVVAVAAYLVLRALATLVPV